MLFLGAAETVIGLTDAFLPHPEHQGMYVLDRKPGGDRLLAAHGAGELNARACAPSL